MFMQQKAAYDATVTFKCENSETETLTYLLTYLINLNVILKFPPTGSYKLDQLRAQLVLNAEISLSSFTQLH